jgi:hypothetical protein
MHHFLTVVLFVWAGCVLFVFWLAAIQPKDDPPQN